MFSSKPKPLSSPSRVSIEEANSHLKLVHQRVEQLETIVTKRDQQLIHSEESHRQEMHRLSHSYDKHCKELNHEIDCLKNKIRELEIKVIQQNEIIEGNEEKLQKLSQMVSFAPNLEKLLKLMNGLAIDNKNSEELLNHNNNQTISCVNDSNNVLNHKNLSKNESIEDMNGFCDEKRESLEDTTRLSQFGTNSDINSDNSSKGIRKYVKYKTNDLCLASGVEEEGVSTTSTSTSGQSPTANSQTASLTNSAEKVSHKKSQNNSKLRIGRSFNITANFSDEEEVVSDRRPSSRRKKVTQI